MLRCAGGGRVRGRGARAEVRERRVLRRGVPRARRAGRAGGQFHGRRPEVRPVPAAVGASVRRRGAGAARVVRSERDRDRAEGRAGPDRVAEAAGPRARARGAARAAVSAVRLQAERDEFLHRDRDRKSTRLNSSHANISYAVFCLKKKNAFALSAWFLISPPLRLLCQRAINAFLRTPIASDAASAPCKMPIFLVNLFVIIMICTSI